ncbi:hypothetical protein [Pseudomonas petrae]|uniref:Phage tail protein n=1 Tax=Pseudomonas petrae TaxID=2912190 RepID=A0ABS9IEC6_9PSED|nr:hypothetical protein [Pseudomonas petrae]MCF7537604.1 hypothetical protein [Pseudomonas petrae]MCF7545846.1 hypothetical protein [Pseudomonas petrae]
MQTTIKEEAFTRALRVTLGVKANGGSVAIQVKMGDNWVTADTLWNDGAYQLNIPRATVRFAPSGGAAFEVFA